MGTWRQSGCARHDFARGERRRPVTDAGGGGRRSKGKARNKGVKSRIRGAPVCSEGDPTPHSRLPPEFTSDCVARTRYRSGQPVQEGFPPAVCWSAKTQCVLLLREQRYSRQVGSSRMAEGPGGGAVCFLCCSCGCGGCCSVSRRRLESSPPAARKGDRCAWTARLATGRAAPALGRVAAQIAT